MDRDSILEQDRMRLESAVAPARAVRSAQGSVSAAIAEANTQLGPNPAAPFRFPGDDGGQSLAEMAHRDLDAALQLLAERAQYITAASGAAIALRHGEQHDMLCRASVGSNAPELGALLSTEFGLSGESVRTRLPLRCDDAERDPRVNREGCRELGIASVAVMPVISDGTVLGVFELFSGQANAFNERDLLALQRLSEMVETAVTLAHASEKLPIEVVADPPVPVEVEPKIAPGPVAAEALAPQVAVSLSPQDPPAETPATEPAPKKPLFWSAALQSSAFQDNAAEPRAGRRSQSRSSHAEEPAKVSGLRFPRVGWTRALRGVRREKMARAIEIPGGTLCPSFANAPGGHDGHRIDGNGARGHG